MASNPKLTVYGPFDNSAWINIPATMAAVRYMEVVEVPTVTSNVQDSFNPQGLQYQLWDPSALNTDGTRGAFGPTMQQLPGVVIGVGDGNTVLGWSAQATFEGARAADNPIRVRSATATTTQVKVSEYVRKFLTA